jgi:tRNA(Ile)-lysidine synthetase-like protein
VIRDYATLRNVPFTEDPSNASLSYFRNRVRHDLLPAIRRVAPRFEDEILGLSRRAADLRREVDAAADHFVVDLLPTRVQLDASSLSELPDDSLNLLLPSLAARAGVTLDRRGLVRLAAVVRAAPGVSGQLSGGYEAVRSRSEVTLQKASASEAATLKLRETGETRFGRFRFRAEKAATLPESQSGNSNPWRIYIPRSAQPVIRQWHAGDRLTTDLTGGRRRVKRFFADAGVVGPLRAGWPVVLCGEEVVWIPGIKASQAAIPLEPGMVAYTCETIRD